MGWIALHTEQSVYPHCTLAWWANDSKGHRLKDQQARDLLLELPYGMPTLIPARTIGVKYFNGTPVALLDTDAVVLVKARRLVSRFDTRPRAILHVSLKHSTEPPNGIYLFKYLGVHTGEFHEYRKLGV